MSEKIADVIKETENNKADRQEQYFFRTDQLDFSSGNPEHKRFGVITRLDGNLCKIILEPDEALAQAMKNSAPSKVFLD